MTIEKLSLSDRRWAALESFGRSEDIPGLLRSLEKSEDPGNEDAYRRLIALIYQQYNCCAATYAVLPYLVEAGGRMETDKNPMPYIDVWHIAATHEPEADGAPRDLLAGFDAALSIAEAKWVEAFLTAPLNALRTYYLGVSLLALSGHPTGKLVKDNFTPAANPESYCFCPSCSTQICAAFFDDGISLRGSKEMKAAPPKEPQIPALPRPARYEARTPNPWEAIASELGWMEIPANGSPAVVAHIKAATELAQAGSISSADNAAAFSLLGALLTLKGHSKAAQRYFYAGNTIRCPECKASFVFADHWWLNKRR